mmetsp:Transcript_26679/g.67571  ORF Transcript_26679/g.67571 Transcript_26679/m.67571 type:complete len:225 (-) Transcript_26679:106-780(-)
MEAVAGTANSAAISKRSAAAFGYVSDEFAGWFDRSSVKCAPIINRGTYVRVAAIDSICEQFAPARADAAGGEPAPPRQILSLGAGLDTRPWRMRRAGASLSRYVEVDLPCVCERKRQLLLKKGGAPPRLPELAEDGGAADAAGSDACSRGVRRVSLLHLRCLWQCCRNLVEARQPLLDLHERCVYRGHASPRRDNRRGVRLERGHLRVRLEPVELGGEALDLGG